MLKRLKLLLCLHVVAGVFFFMLQPAFAEGARENRLFTKEFALFVQDRLNNETKIRADIRAFIAKNKGKVKENFGKHPELIPEMFEAAGVGRVNCIQGRYWDEFTLKLNNEERHFFYENAQKLDWWVMMIAVEEADSMGVFKRSPPIQFRLLTDVPFYVALSMRSDIKPFLEAEPLPGDTYSYNKLNCD